MSKNYEGFDNLQMRNSSVVQERAGLVAVHMYKQYLEFQQITVNVNEILGSIVKNVQAVIEYFKQSFCVRNLPVQNIKFVVDNANATVNLHILWHTISFTSRLNMTPKALPRKEGLPLFCGRIFALDMDFYDILKNIDGNDEEAVLRTALEHEIASLYVPAEKNQSAIITIKHKDNQELYVGQSEAAREFVLKVVEIVCAGGDFHEQWVRKF